MTKSMSVEQFSEAIAGADFDTVHAQLDKFGNDALEAIDRFKAQRDALRIQNETFVSTLRAIAAELTWNECAAATPQVRPTKADISIVLDRCIAAARASLSSTEV